MGPLFEIEQTFCLCLCHVHDWPLWALYLYYYFIVMYSLGTTTALHQWWKMFKVFHCTPWIKQFSVAVQPLRCPLLPIWPTSNLMAIALTPLNFLKMTMHPRTPPPTALGTSDWSYWCYHIVMDQVVSFFSVHCSCKWICTCRYGR